MFSKPDSITIAPGIIRILVSLRATIRGSSHFFALKLDTPSSTGGRKNTLVRVEKDNLLMYDGKSLETALPRDRQKVMHMGMSCSIART